MSGIPAGAGQLLGKRLGKFEILALLALGGTAEIYLARIGGAAGFEKYVVVKCLHDHLADDAEFVKMFLDEARLAAHLDHSNIVQTMELGEHAGRYYMVMEFLAGLSLAMIVRRAAERLPTGRIPLPLVLNILAQASAGLHYAHEKAASGKALNIVHRDISPQNLVISFEGVVKLVDFGIAKAELRETRTRSGTIKGKFAYMSPEQCVANNVDRRTDVFALGVIGHELLTGRRLFKRPSPYETYQAVLECDVKPPSTLDPEIDPALDQVIMRAVTKDKAERYPSAEAFGDALQRYLHHRSMGSSPSDVSRFFDGYFGQEIEEYSARMRELIAGRDVSVDTGVSWGSGADDDRPSDEMAAHRSSAMSLLLDDFGGGSRNEADDEMPAERTRIESNPLERVNELERMTRGPAAPSAPHDGATLLAPALAVAPPGAELASAAPPAAAFGAPAGSAPSSGRFPDLANLPTVIAGVDPGVTAAPSSLPPPTALPAHALTQIAPMPVASGTPASGAPSGHAGHPVPGAAGASARASVSPPLPGLPPPSGTPGAPGAFGAPGAMASQPPPAIAGPHLPGGSAPVIPQPPPVQGLPVGYPVMNAELSAQIATGATVFPSEAPRPGPPPSGQLLAAPPGLPPSGPLLPPAPGPRGSEPGPIDAQRAAGVMSPVGQHYPENVDWAAMAAGRARAVPPWLLAVLFVGAIGIALALTVVITRLTR